MRIEKPRFGGAFLIVVPVGAVLEPRYDLFRTADLVDPVEPVRGHFVAIDLVQHLVAAVGIVKLKI